LPNYTAMISTAQQPTGSATSDMIDITQSLKKYITTNSWLCLMCY